MNVLLDTRCLLWWMSDLKKLGKRARGLIRDPNNTIYVSAVSALEISIKSNLGKLQLPEEPVVWMTQAMRTQNFTALPVTIEHAATVGELPIHHRDPFDRLLIAQSKVEKVPVLTADKEFGKYNVHTVAALQ